MIKKTDAGITPESIMDYKMAKMGQMAEHAHVCISERSFWIDGL